MLNRPMWGGGLVRTLVFLPWCLSLFAAGLMFAYMARGQTGLGTSIAYALGIPRSVDFMTSALVIEVLALGAAWTMAPLVAFFLLANLKTIPKPLYDLAALDQLSRLETFRFVTLPPLGVRPQDMCVVAPEREGALQVKVFAMEHLGRESVLIAESGDGSKIRVPTNFRARMGDHLALLPVSAHCLVLGADGRRVVGCSTVSA
jgi:Binding-protein-dependent transport system inner membrane component